MMGCSSQHARTAVKVDLARSPGQAGAGFPERWPRPDADDREIGQRLVKVTEFYRQAAAGPAEVPGVVTVATNSLDELLARFLTPWSAGDIGRQMMAAGVLSAMAGDKLVSATALDIAVTWARDGGQEQAATAAIAFGGPLGQRHLAQALHWLWALVLREAQISSVARLALGRLFAAEIELNGDKSTVADFLVHKIRPLLHQETATHERRAALSAVNSALNAGSAESATPAVARLIQARQPDLAPVSELWAAALNSVPHRRMAVIALHLTLAALTGTAEAADAAAPLGEAILPRLTTRTREVLELTLPDPQRTEAIPTLVIDAFLGAQREMVGASRC